MDFRTKIDLPKSGLVISHQSKILMFGSCFAENIGALLIDNKFDVRLNPFGILYNPLSISQALKVLLEGKQFGEEDIFFHNGLYHSFLHHGDFSNIDKSQCLEAINNSGRESVETLKNADVLLITFGTAYVYRDKTRNMVVGNCHKLPSSQFDRFRLNVKDIVDEWASLIESLRETNPSLQILFTVSPVRHLRDGAYDNQLSKSTLLLAIDEMKNAIAGIHYFPSYEIVLDELRDYRFYNEDMVHPNRTAIKYIWDRFADVYFNEDTKNIIKEWQKIHAAMNHRPINRESEEYKRFLRQTLLNLEVFKEKYPYICCCNEMMNITSQL